MNTMKIVKKILLMSVGAIISGLVGYLLAEVNKPDVRLDIQAPMILDVNRITIYRLSNKGGGSGNDIEVRFSDMISKEDVTVINAPDSLHNLENGFGFGIPKLRPNEFFSFYIKEPRNAKINPQNHVIKAVYGEGVITGSTDEYRMVLIKLEAFFFGGGAGFALGALLIAIGFVLGESRKKKKSNATDDGKNIRVN